MVRIRGEKPIVRDEHCSKRELADKPVVRKRPEGEDTTVEDRLNDLLLGS